MGKGRGRGKGKEKGRGKGWDTTPSQYTGVRVEMG